MSICQISCRGKKYCILASSVEDCIEKISLKCYMPKSALVLLSQQGYQIECDLVFGQLCEKGSAFEMKWNENANREDAREQVNVSGAFCSDNSNYSNKSRHLTNMQIWNCFSLSNEDSILRSKDSLSPIL
jgi:hypothetical protein